jgi:hypothetical protein
MVAPPPMRTSFPPAAARADLERLGRRSVDEVEGRAALHFDRRARMMREDEDRRVERRVGAPPALPARVLVPAGGTELARTHDLGANSGSEQPQEGVVDATGAAGLVSPLVPPARLEHPFMQPFAGMTERGFEGQAFAGRETVKRDGELLDTGK